jgi:hypothetical protein
LICAVLLHPRIRVGWLHCAVIEKEAQRAVMTYETLRLDEAWVSSLDCITRAGAFTRASVARRARLSGVTRVSTGRRLRTIAASSRGIDAVQS